MRTLKFYKIVLIILVSLSSAATYTKLDLLRIERFCSLLLISDYYCTETLTQCIGDDVFTFDDCRIEYLQEEHGLYDD